MTDRKSEAFTKAVRFIWDNIDQPIKLAEIAKAANVSLSSLKRIFANTADKSPGEFSRRLRMELAFRSLQSRNDTVLEIALSSGFDDQSAFSRCFKEAFGYPPSEARKRYNVVNELESISLALPDIVELSDLTIQCVTQQGLYFESAKRAWDILNENLNPDELSDDFSGVFIGIGHDNPHEGEVAADKVRFSAGIALLDRDLRLDHYKIPAGNYARFRYVGKPVNLGFAYHYIYGKWLEDSKIKIKKNIPAFMACDRFPSALKEEQILIHVPLV